MNGHAERIALIAMPVMEINRPSLSLAQLASVVRRRHGSRVQVEVLHLYHDFARWMAAGRRVGGTDLYQLLVDNQRAEKTGLPDWFFRAAAFDGVPDNAAEYFRRYFPGRSPAVQELKEAILERRADLDRFLDELIDRYRIDTARIAGFTSMFAQNVASFAMARKLKQRNPEIAVVMGGANCESPMGQEIARHVAAVDYVFSGPGLVGFPTFVGHWLDGRRDLCEAIPGVFSKAVPDRPRSEQIGTELEIDADVELDYDPFFASYERHFDASRPAPMVLLETSRGCWWGERSHCTFCGLNGMTMGYRAMSPPKAIALFRGLFERYRDRSSYFFCVDNIMPREYVKEVLPHLGTPPGTDIFYEVKADLKDDALRAMADAGVKILQPGIESMATSTLTLMRKGTTAFVNLRFLKSCLRYGITPVWNLLVGFPGEGEDVYRKYVADLWRLQHLPPPQVAGQVRFDRYSPYFVEAKEHGLRLRYFDFYPLVYPFDDAALSNLAYYFMDLNFDAAHYQALARWIRPLDEAVGRWSARWKDAGSAGRPRLELERTDGAAVVHDTRAAEAAAHALEPAAVLVLEHLARARKTRELEELAADRGFALAPVLHGLDERGLVWREGERWMSLVT